MELFTLDLFKTGRLVANLQSLATLDNQSPVLLQDKPFVLPALDSFLKSALDVVHLFEELRDFDAEFHLKNASFDEVGNEGVGSRAL